jgi:hypothetical protein
MLAAKRSTQNQRRSHTDLDGETKCSISLYGVPFIAVSLSSTRRAFQTSRAEEFAPLRTCSAGTSHFLMRLFTA